MAFLDEDDDDSGEGVKENMSVEDNGNLEEKVDDGDSVDHHFSPLFGSLNGTFSPAKRARPAQTSADTEESRSAIAQASLLGLLSIMIITVVSFSFLAVISSNPSSPYSRKIPYSLAHRVNKVDTNILGLYYIKMPQPASSATTSGALPSSPADRRTSAEVEAFFLRYFVMPLEETESAITVDSTVTFDGNYSDTITVQTSTTRLLKPRARLLHTTKVLGQELADTTKEDIMEPLKQRWSNRVNSIKRRIVPNTEEETDDGTTAQEEAAAADDSDVAKGKAVAIHTLGGASPNSIFGIYPKADGEVGDGACDMTRPNEKKLGATIKHAIQDGAMYLPKIGRSKGKSACPTSLFCYYTLPPTTKAKPNTVCPKYCGRCLETKSELKLAIGAYLEDPSHTSKVAQTYGWPIGNWCVSLITDFSELFADAANFNEDLRLWDLSSATTIPGDFPGRG